jgi:hypothetical protein
MTEVESIDTAIWEPGENGYLKLVRRKTVREVYDELRAAVGEYPEGGEEYFIVTSWQCYGDGGADWPDGRIVVYSVNGSSEGDYVHVEVARERERYPLLLAKTFAGRDASWAFARRLADLLEA